MSGVAVIRSLLAASSSVLTVVPTSRIKAGVLPLNTELPAISVTQISSNPHNFIRINEQHKLHTDRVQVTALFKDPSGYPGLKAMMKLILAACPSQRGTVNGISVDSIAPQGEGPDFYNDVTGIYECSRDFMVKYVGD